MIPSCCLLELRLCLALLFPTKQVSRSEVGNFHRLSRFILQPVCPRLALRHSCGILTRNLPVNHRFANLVMIQS
ncbi:hypothetical protein HDV64DRAFT_251962 [Trichoderma sp. TUCIM 5745]